MRILGPVLGPVLGVALALAAAQGAAPPASAEAPRLPGVAATDRRAPVDGSAHPWASLAKVQAVFGPGRRGSCTGALVGPALVLTAAHCLFGPGARGPVPPGSVHVLFGYERGAHASHHVAESIRVGPGFEGPRPGAGTVSGADWALVRLPAAGAPAAPPLPVSPEPPGAGEPLALAGFGQDRAHRLLADLSCRLGGTARDAAGRALLLHDCSGPAGTSGAPLLARRGGRWEVVGVHAAAAEGRNLAVAAAGFAGALMDAGTGTPARGR
jgi:protease YdgD